MTTVKIVTPEELNAFELKMILMFPKQGNNPALHMSKKIKSVAKFAVKGEWIDIEREAAKRVREWLVSIGLPEAAAIKFLAISEKYGRTRQVLTDMAHMIWEHEVTQQVYSCYVKRAMEYRLEDIYRDMPDRYAKDNKHTLSIPFTRHAFHTPHVKYQDKFIKPDPFTTVHRFSVNVRHGDYFTVAKYEKDKSLKCLYLVGI